MALVKTSALRPPRKSDPATPATVPAPAAAPRPQKGGNAIERVDAATQELASGLVEAAAAVTQLHRSIDQISSGAEEAAGAAQESLGLIEALGESFRDARERSEASRRQTDLVQTAFGEAAAQISQSVAAIRLNAQRQRGSVDKIAALEQAADDIAAIGRVVADLSDQTGLLALNAAIEAARAGDGGAGFAIVADEVRALAESSEASARDIRGLAEVTTRQVQQIVEQTGAAASLAEEKAALGDSILVALEDARADFVALGASAQEIASAAAEADGAAREATRGAEQVAAAAEEQAAAAAEALQAIGQQSGSLEQSQQTAEALGQLTHTLRSDQGNREALEQVAAAAEELSATVQELSGAAAEILVAVEQIARGTEAQAAATIQANGAMAQIEGAAGLAADRAQATAERIGTIASSTQTSRDTLGDLVGGVSHALADTRNVLGLLTALSQTSRRIEKIADGLGLIAVQTSMLAVSGSVESTRAGEAGRGFATVSDDIRKLSRESASNAERAKDVVRDIQDQIALTSRDLDQIVGTAEGEIARNAALAERFGEIVDNLDSARTASDAIRDAAAGALRAASEIRGGTEQIASAAELAAGAAREAGVAARQQSQTAEDLAVAIEEIASIAAALNSHQG